jgi:hypothetical protein
LAIGIGCAVVAGDHAAHRDAAEGVHAQQHASRITMPPTFSK